MSILYICEKPSQARDIARMLGATQRCDGFIEGNGVKVTWCLGHLLELAPPDDYCQDLKPWRMEVLPVVPENWHLTVKLRTKAQFTVVKKLLKNSDLVIVATDADREGDVIGREVIEVCGYKGEVQRLWLSALDDASIKKALANIKPGSATYPLYLSGLGRARADWLIGMNMTMATSALFGNRAEGVLSVGRVQTPTLNLVVTRDLAIEDFKSKDYFELQAQFESDKGVFWAKWRPREDVLDEQGYCLERNTVELIEGQLLHSSAEVKAYSDKLQQISAPSCLSLSELQKIASKRFGYGAKQTLEIAQSLYEKHKATTYPRTDSGFLPENQFSEAGNIMEGLSKIDPDLKSLVDQCDLSFKSPAWNDKKVTAHHGIIPTSNTSVSLQSMSEPERQCYDLIRRHYIAQFLGNHTFMQRKVAVLASNEHFVATCNAVQEIGWKSALTISSKDVADDQDAGRIPELATGEKLAMKDSKIESKKTKPPARYTEGLLITAMKNIARHVEDPRHKRMLKETAGIGTEATRANIIETLLKRDYIRHDKKTLVSTPRARQLIKLLPGAIKDPITTAIWEGKLDDMAQGKGDLPDFLEAQKIMLKTMLDALAHSAKSSEIITSGDSKHICPDCSAPLLKRKGKNGDFWGCARYPECKTTLENKAGKPVAREPLKLSSFDCPICKSNKLIRRKGKKGFWWGCSGYPQCKATLWDAGGRPNFDTPQRPS